MAVHVSMPPALERCPGVVRELAVDLDKLVQDPSGKVQALVAEMLPQDQEHLAGVSPTSRCSKTKVTCVDLLYPIPVLVVSGDVGAISDQDVAALFEVLELGVVSICVVQRLTHCPRQSRSLGRISGGLPEGRDPA